MKIVTHSGSFHPDEIFATATLLIYLKNDQVEIIRSREPEIIAIGDFVVDVGGQYDGEKCFDHHQGGIAARENGIPYASFGLVWKRFGPELCGSGAVFNTIDKSLAQAIDAKDNGVDVETSLFGDVFEYPIWGFIKASRPTWKEDASDIDKRFIEMVEFAKKLLAREIKVAQDNEEGRRIAEDAYVNASDKRILILERYVPWEEAASSHPEPLMVVYPGLTGDDWHVQVTRDDIQVYKNRIDFPDAWRGLRDEALVQATGVPGAVFCHVGGFFASAKTREAAVRLAELAVAS